MVASTERQHRDRTARLEKYKTNILPVAAIYGANASGKSNFLAALNFAKGLVVEGVKPDRDTGTRPFLLDKSSSSKPSSFTFEILVDDIVYEYSFTVSKKKVIEEALSEIRAASSKLLFQRKGVKHHFHNSLEDKKKLELIFESTRENQLLLTSTIDHNYNHFRPVYEWFRDSLVLITPDSQYGLFNYFYNLSNIDLLLRQLDTGIEHLKLEAIDLRNTPPPQSLLDSMKDAVNEGEVLLVSPPDSKDKFLFSMRSGELIMERLMTVHNMKNGGEVVFGLSQESDGSLRLIDLLPAFLKLADNDSSSIFFIDEIDRSLHTLLVRELITRYLASCNAEFKSQLLFTTHDVQLFDQSLLRRDEMWLTEKNNIGESELFSLREFEDIRHDKDIRKSYLHGRLGGIPAIYRTDSPLG